MSSSFDYLSRYPFALSGELLVFKAKIRMLPKTLENKLLLLGVFLVFTGGHVMFHNLCTLYSELVMTCT